MATTSACAVGSLVVVTRLTPSATIRPSFTITAAKGPPPPVRTFSLPSAIARRMNSSDMARYPVSGCLDPRQIATWMCPSRHDGERRFARHDLLRCARQAEGGEFAAKVALQSHNLRGEGHSMKDPQIGKAVPRKEGREKVTG